MNGLACGRLLPATPGETFRFRWTRWGGQRMRRRLDRSRERKRKAVQDRGQQQGGQQFAALPFAEIEGEVRVLLVTSRETRRWVLPKGWAEEGLTPAELAAKEAFEEAGALGSVVSEAIGAYRYSKRLKTGQELWCEVGVYPLHVEQLLGEWPEAHQRERRWFSPAQAAEQVQEEDLAALLRQLPELPPGA